MEKYNTIQKNSFDETVDYYKFSSKIVRDDLPKILSLLDTSGVKIVSYRFSNNEESPEHYFGTFTKAKDAAIVFWDSSIIIDEAGLVCDYRGVRFSLTVDFVEGVVLTFTKRNINLEPLLMQIEQICQKKTR